MLPAIVRMIGRNIRKSFIHDPHPRTPMATVSAAFTSFHASQTRSVSRSGIVVSAVASCCLSGIKNYAFLLSVILAEKLYVFVQLLQKYVWVKFKNSCLHSVTDADMWSSHIDLMVDFRWQTAVSIRRRDLFQGKKTDFWFLGLYICTIRCYNGCSNDLRRSKKW